VTQSPVDRLVELLQVERLDPTTCRGVVLAGLGGRAYGGHIAAHALAAAGLTVAPARVVCSLHADYITAGVAEQPFDYVVHKLRDGGSFSVRRIEARQGDLTCLEATALFGPEETSTEHQAPLPVLGEPALGAPESYERVDDISSPAVRPITGMLDLRAVTPLHHDRAQPPVQTFWIGLPGISGLGPRMLACVLAYLSDIGMTRVVDRPHLAEPGVRRGATLDHSIWLHRQRMAGDWLLTHQQSPVYAGSRGLALASFSDLTGTLIASQAQQALIRHRIEEGHL
jgi:acyl-CoA thioesterase-2